MRYLAATFLFSILFCFSASANSYLCEPHYNVGVNPSKKDITTGKGAVDVLLTFNNKIAEIKWLSEPPKSQKFEIFNWIGDEWFLAGSSSEPQVLNFDKHDRMLVYAQPTSGLSFFMYYNCI